MLRNLPCRLTRKGLTRILDDSGFEGLYDFVYVPFDFDRKLCMGFAFVNLTSSELVQRFIEVFDGVNCWFPIESHKVCRASLSHTLGLAAKIERIWNSPIIWDWVPERFRPALFVGGRQVVFSEPNLKLRPHQ
jgi:hypothetical protein